MKAFLKFGGVVAGVILIGFGIGAIWMSTTGLSTVQSSLKQEKIVGTPDMTPKGIAAEAKAAHLPANISLPSCSVAGQAIDNGSKARCFASYMRIHALEATGGKTYAQMPRYATADGVGTNDPAAALKGANGQPQDNLARQVWVTETALSTALDVSYMAQQLSYFGLVVGVALLLSGAGFIILATNGAISPSRRSASQAVGAPVTA